MKKRFLSLFLALCMLLPCLPLAALGAEGNTGEGGDTVTVTFQRANGTVICTREHPAGYMWLMAPTEAEMTAAGMTAAEIAEIIGWYYMAPDGKYYDIGAYTSIRLEKDITISPFTKTSTFYLPAWGNGAISAPLYTPGASGAVVPLDGWQGGFTVGYANRSDPLGTYTLFGEVDTAAGLLRKSGGYEWTQGGLYVNSGNVGFIQPNLTSDSNGYTVLSWCAMVSGTVNITIDIPAADQVSLLVAKNGSIVYPAAGEGTTVSATDRATWYTKDGSTAVDDLAVATGLTVSAGDEIRFIMARGGSDTISAVWPTITYTNDLSAPTFSDAIIYGKTTSFDTHKPTLDKTGKTVTFDAAWDIVYYDTVAAIADQAPTLLNTFSKVDAEYTNLSLSGNAETNYDAITAGAYFGTRAELGGRTADTFAIMVQGSHVAGYRYTAEHSGMIRFDFTKLGRFSTQTSTNAQIGYAVYVDGVKVWPTTATGTNGWYTYAPVASADNDHTAAANAMDAAARRGIVVQKGSTVEFLCTNTAGGSIWGGSGNLMYADITYEKAMDGVTAFGENLPVYDQVNDVVTFTGNWSLVHYANTGAIADGAANFLTKGARINSERDALTIPAEAGKKADNQPAILATASIATSAWASAGAYTYTMAIKGGNVGGYRYTAPYNGFIDIDFTKLGHFCTMNGNANTAYAIYVDGVKVWPAGDDWFKLGEVGTQVKDVTAAANATDAAARRNLYVHKGSRVELLCTTPSGASIWGGAGNLMYADITYHEVDPGLTMSATLGSALALHVALGNTAAYRDVTVRLNGQAITADHGIFTLGDIAAREIEDVITYEISGKLYGRNVLIAKGETSLADYLARVAQDDTQTNADRMLAEATLQYGCAAKKYFENGTLTAAEEAQIATAPTTTGTASRVENTVPANNLFTFSAVSLLLNDEIDIKLYIDALGDVASPGDYTIRVTSEKVNGAGWTLQPRTGTAAGHFKAIVTGIPAIAYGTDLSITVMQGETAVSDTLIYSVDAYIARTYATGSTQGKNLLHAIARLGDVAGGAHLHVYGAWALNGTNAAGQRLEKRICALCAHEDVRTVETLDLVYQDTHTFSGTVEAISNENVTSTDPLSGAADTHVLIKTGEKTIEAVGTGTAVVKTAEGHYTVTVGAAPINMLFLSGQSNAAGGMADGAEYNENNKYQASDYADLFKRSPARMAYYTFTYHDLDITAEESSGHTPASYVVKTLKWGNNTRYSTVQSGPSVTTLCDENSTCQITGVGAALSAEWIAQTGERVWLVNSAHGGHPIQNFLPEGTTGKGEVPEAKYNDYEQAVAVFKLAIETLENEITAGHFSLSHMAFYWFQGESDSSSNDLYYLEQFDRMYGELKNDVKLGERTLDFGGLFTVRSCKDSSGNSQAELYMTGPRLAQYEIGADNGASHAYQNAYVVTNATEQWTSSDEAVEEYFLSVYGSAENFKALFGYDMPTTRAMLHPNIHYAIYGQNEMGIDAARNSLLIMNLLGLSDYDLPYAVQEAATTIRLVQTDGYTPLTEITMDVTSGMGYVIPLVTPIYRVAQGMTLVSETEGYVFDQFRLSIEEGYTGTPASEITFKVMLGGAFLQRYTLPVRFTSSILLDADLSYAQYGGEQNPARETVVYQTGAWKRGYIDYATGTCHPFDYYDATNGWYYGEGETLWTGANFHGAYHPSSGLGMSSLAGSGAAIYWQATKAGTVTPYFDTLNTNLGEADIAIMVNGVLVWPAGAGTNYDVHSGWYRAYNGDTAGETATTAAMINEVLADCQITLAEGDVVAFVFERVNSVGNITAMPGLIYAGNEEA